MVHDEKGAVAIILGKLKKPKHEAEEKAEEKPEESLEACAEELLTAIKADDAAGVAEALKAFFHIADSMPHEEGEHLGEDEEY